MSDSKQSGKALVEDEAFAKLMEKVFELYDGKVASAADREAKLSIISFVMEEAFKQTFEKGSTKGYVDGFEAGFKQGFNAGFNAAAVKKPDLKKS